MKLQFIILCTIICLCHTLASQAQSSLPISFQWQQIAHGGDNGGFANYITDFDTDAQGNFYGAMYIYGDEVWIDTIHIVNPGGFNSCNAVVFSLDCNGRVRWANTCTSGPFFCKLNKSNEVVIEVFAYAGSNPVFGHNKIMDTTLWAVGNPLNTTNFNGAYVLVKINSATGKVKKIKQFGADYTSLGDHPEMFLEKTYKNADGTIEGVFENFTLPSSIDTIAFGKIPVARNKPFGILKLDIDALEPINIVQFQFGTLNNQVYSQTYNSIMRNAQGNYFANVDYPCTPTVAPLVKYFFNNQVDSYYTKPAVNNYFQYPTLFYLMDSADGHIIKYYNKLIVNDTDQIIKYQLACNNNKFFISHFVQKNYSSFFKDTIKAYYSSNPNFTNKYNFPMSCLDLDSQKIIWHTQNDGFASGSWDINIARQSYTINKKGELVGFFGHEGAILNGKDTINKNIYWDAGNYFTHNDTSQLRLAGIDTATGKFLWIGNPITANFYSSNALLTPMDIISDSNDNILMTGIVRDSLWYGNGKYVNAKHGLEFAVMRLGTSKTYLCACTASTATPSIISNAGGVVTATALPSATADSMLWYWGDGSFSKYTAFGTNISHMYTDGETVHKICLEVYSTCGRSIKCISNNAVGLNTIGDLQVALYPNPSNGLLQLSNPNSEGLTITAYNMQGQIVLNSVTTATMHVLHLNQLPNGLYNFKIVSKNGEQFWQKIIKE
jgi:Secretion system C-terminal sorting domain